MNSSIQASRVYSNARLEAIVPVSSASSIRTITVGFGISPKSACIPDCRVAADNRYRRVADSRRVTENRLGRITASEELHLALKQNSWPVLYRESARCARGVSEWNFESQRVAKSSEAFVAGVGVSARAKMNDASIAKASSHSRFGVRLFGYPGVSPLLR